MIQNISPEEVENLKKKVKEKETVEVFRDTADVKTPTNTIEDVQLKQKSSVFEPNPVKYRLLTTNNVIKKNLTSNEEIFIRRMGGEEDIHLQSMLYTENIFEVNTAITKIIEGCIKSNIDVRTIPILEKIPLFLFILSISLEDNFDAAPIPGCKTCDDDTKVYLKFSDFEKIYMPKDSQDYPKKLKLQTYKDANINIELELPKLGSEGMFLENSKNKQEYIQKLLQIISNIYGTKPDGEEVRKSDWVEIINFLDIDNKEAIKELQDKWAEDYKLSSDIKITHCTNPECCMLKTNTKVNFNMYELMRKFLLNMVKTDQIILKKPLNE